MIRAIRFHRLPQPGPQPGLLGGRRRAKRQTKQTTVATTTPMAIQCWVSGVMAALGHRPALLPTKRSLSLPAGVSKRLRIREEMAAPASFRLHKALQL